MALDLENDPSSLSGFGAKTIGFWGSMFLICNNICGPGMVQIPCMYQQAGWLLPTIGFLLIALLTYVATLYLARSIASMPGNHTYRHRIEVATITSHLFPRWVYIITMIALVGSFTATNIASIIVSAQVMDNTIIAAAGKTCALIVYQDSDTNYSTFDCMSRHPGDVTDSPFGEGAYVISLGYFVVMAIVIPMGIFNLDDNIYTQIGGVILLVACVGVWAFQFIDMGLNGDYIPVVDEDGLSGVLSGVVFNYAFVASIPSWLNEKHAGVSIPAPTALAITIATVLFLILGFFGGFGLPPEFIPDTPSGCTDILGVLDGGDVPGTWLISKIATYVFPIANLMSTIPVFCILVRYNLLSSHLCTRRWVANILAVVLPWIIALFFYAGNRYKDLANWSAAILFSYINLILPFSLFLLLHYRKETKDEQSSLLGPNTPSIGYYPSTDGMLRLVPAWWPWSELKTAWALLVLSIIVAILALALQIQGATK